MGWFITLTVVVLIASLALAIIAAGAVTIEDEQTREKRTYKSGPALITLIVTAVLVVFGTVLASYHQIEAGEIGIVRSFGEIDGQLSEGANFIAPWKTVETFDIRVQKAQFRNGALNEDENEDALGRIEAASIETQDVFMDITVNWRVSPTAVQSLVREVGPNFFEVLVPTRVRQHAKAEVVRHTAVEATQLREEIREAIEVALQEDLDQFSITVVSIQIDNISYQSAFSEAIEQKQVATQQALAAEEVVARKEAEARQNIAEASGKADAAIETARGEAEKRRIEAAGDADARITRAMGEAEAIRLEGDAVADANAAIALSLTADLIQFSALDHLDGVELAFLPADGSILLDPTGILRRN